MKNYLNKILISFFTVISLGFSQDNYSLSFDGVDDWIESQSIDLTGSPFTIETWFKMPEVNFTDQTNIIDNYETSPSTDKRWGIYIGGLNQEYTGKVYFTHGDLYSLNRVEK